MSRTGLWAVLAVLSSCEAAVWPPTGRPLVDAPPAPDPVDAGTPDTGTDRLDAGLEPDAGPDAPDASVVVITNRGVANPACPDELATIVSVSLPTRMTAFRLAHASVTVENSGRATWSEAQEYRLGSPTNADPFVDNARSVLPGQTHVSPTQRFTFTFDLRAPGAAGTYWTQWQMVKEGTCFFGDRLAAPIVVDAPHATGACVSPTPRPLDHLDARVHIVGPNRITLDSTPKVCDRDYCAEIGFTDGRLCCPPRPEGDPDVDVCNLAVVGVAADTGRPGPTWTFDGQRCGPDGPGNCTNHPTNQFLLFVYGPGTARACGNLNSVCGEVVVP